MKLCPFATLDGTAWINPVHVVSVLRNPTDPQRTDQPRAVIYTVNGAPIYVMPNLASVIERLIEWGRTT